MIQGNLTAVFHLLKLVVPIMRKQNFGRIINYGFQGADSAPGGFIVQLLQQRK